MTTPTRQEIIDAYTAATTLARLAEEFTPVRVEEHKEINDLHLAVRAALPPRPQPTMAEIDWLDGVHYLAEAEHKDGRIVIMLTRDSSTRINFIWNELIDSTHPQNLTPTGRLYTLTEVE